MEKRRATGIVRKVDELGRIVIPIELRRTMGIDDNDALEIYTTSEEIIFKKYNPACQNCNDAKDLITLGKIRVCKNCAFKLGIMAANDH